MAESAPLAYVLAMTAHFGDCEPAAADIATRGEIVSALESVVADARAANDPKRLFRKEALDRSELR